MDHPHFSIIIPTYNRADKIAKALNSVLTHSCRHFEVFLVDDDSTDNTKEVVASLIDKRIRYYCKKNEERAIARNFSISKAEGDYITFLDSDDSLYPNFFE